MKNSIKTLLRAGVFALAAVFAFAFSPIHHQDVPLYGTPDGGETWIRINDPQNPVNYQCDPGDESCLYTDEDLGSPAGAMDSKFILQ
ncbi:MAG: hypothetical protein LPJ98_10800 [Cyclobacteriaceae bacterium]|nr:hypothetical protein [Cyclobacteriaceae bacterium]